MGFLNSLKARYGKSPSFSQWKQIFKVLKKKEKIIFLIFLLLAIVSLVFLFFDFYIKNTKIVPAAGEAYIEGISGQPRFINPIYGEANDVDRDLIELIYSGLMTYNNEGKLVKDLVKEYKILEEGKIYEFFLKDDVYWHDGQPLTADDVVFTIKTIQNSDYKSPLRTNWLGIEVERISEKSFRLRLKNPYGAFLENCTVKILPKHIWEDILPQNFSLSPYNLQPVGSGPFKFKGLKQAETGVIKSLDLEVNQNYYGKTPFISKISFIFFNKEEDMVAAFNKKEIDGFSLTSLRNYDLLKTNGFSLYSFPLPRYFAVFLNIGQSKIFAEKDVRTALNYALDKTEIVKQINSIDPNKETVRIVDSPILPDFFGYNPPKNQYEYDLEKAGNLLDKAGFKENESGIRERITQKTPAFQFKSTLSTGSKGKEVEELQKCLAKDTDVYPEGEVTGYFGNATKRAVIKFQKKYVEDTQGSGTVGKKTRDKLNEMCAKPSQENLPLQFTITTVNQPQLVAVADILKSQWEKIGAVVEANALDISELKPVIKERNYESLLFGEVLGSIPDPFPFWHSSQKADPGLNLSSYENKDVDKLLKEARETLDGEKRKEKLESLQDILINDAPAIFLYSPDYVYIISSKVKGVEDKKIVDPAKRFLNIEGWYVKTKRVWSF